MKINVYKYLRTGKFIEHAILMTITKDILAKAPKYKNKKFKKLDITMHIEGQEIDLIKFFDHMEKEWRSSVSKSAENLFEEKASEKMGEIYDSLNQLEAYAKELSSKIDWNVE